MSSKREAKQDDNPVPKQMLRSLSVSPQHYADLKSLERNREFLTPEHPNLLKYYFRGLALNFEEFEKAFQKDISTLNKVSLIDAKKAYENEAKLWRVTLLKGVKISVTKKPNNKVPPHFNGTGFDGKFFVKVEQTVEHNGSAEICLPNGIQCMFCGEKVKNLDIHLLYACRAKGKGI